MKLGMRKLQDFYRCLIKIVLPKEIIDQTSGHPIDILRMRLEPVRRRHFLQNR